MLLAGAAPTRRSAQAQGGGSRGVQDRNSAGARVARCERLAHHE